MSATATRRRFGVGDLFGVLLLTAIGYAILGRVLHDTGRIALSTYQFGLAVTLACEALLLVGVVVVFRGSTDGGPV